MDGIIRDMYSLNHIEPVIRPSGAKAAGEIGKELPETVRTAIHRPGMTSLREEGQRGL